MSRKNSTAKTLKNTGRAVHAVGKGTANVGRFSVIHWRGLLPFLCVAAAALFAGSSELFALVYGPSAWFWTIAVGLILFWWAEGWAGTQEIPVRYPALAFLVFTVAATVMIILAANVLEVWFGIGLTALILGTWWWNGTAYQGHKTTERARRKMETVLRKLNISEGTRITSTRIHPNKDREWRLFLGDHDRPDQITAADVAHMLKTDVSRIIVRRPEKGSTRALKIVHLARSAEKSADPVHPAVHEANRAAGAAWEPGKRSVLDGFVSGNQLGAAEHALVRTYTTKGQDVRHFGILGATGSGKTSTTSGILLSAVASGDLVLGVCDIPKAGNLGEPFRPCLHRIATTYDQLESDLLALLVLGQDRIRRMGEGRILGSNGKKLRKWRPTRKTPALGYVIDELGNTMRDLAAEDPDRAEKLWDLLISVVQSVRQAGIFIMWASQDAKRESINTTFRKAMGSFVVHRVATTQCVNGIWSEHDLDMFESGLPSAGMNYTGDTDGGAPYKAIGFDMDKLIEDGDEFDAAVNAYAEHRPNLMRDDVAVLGWGDTLCSSATAEADQAPEAAPAAPEAAQEGDNVVSLLQDALENDETIPAGAGIIGGDADPEDGDDESLRVILEALEAAEDGLTRTQVEQALKAKERPHSMSTAKRLLRVLQDKGKISRDGDSRSSRYHFGGGEAAAVAA
jgi:hypothetical protein